ncbi:MAG: hypothetical protein JXA21_30260 [Anaerolineae bacterium]|nr:hypothetical protein [Anaerolineae bacterium]
MCTRSHRRPPLLFFLLLLVVLWVIYQQLSDAQKRLVVNTLKQLPYLPARYAV